MSIKKLRVLHGGVMREISNYQSSILQAIAWLCRHKEKRYCFPSQAALVKILSNTYSIKRCRRTLNYQLSDLERHGYIRRLRRTHEGKDGQIVFASTIYRLASRGLAFLGRIVKCLSHAGVAAWARAKKIAHEDNWPRVQSLLSGISRAIPPG